MDRQLSFLLSNLSPINYNSQFDLIYDLNNNFVLTTPPLSICSPQYRVPFTASRRQ